MATKKEAPPTETIVGYKGFDADLKCRGYQFEIGETHEHTGSVVACSSGFHFCESPLDVWSYYPPEGGNRFCRVHGGGSIARHEGDSKVAAGSLYVETEVNLGEMIRAGVAYEIAAAKNKTDSHSATNASSGHSARNASSGDYATNASSGHSARNASSGDYATNASSGDYATNASSGDYATNASSGHSARNASSGHSARNASSGDYATNASSGHYATNASSGHSARNEATGMGSVIAAAGLLSQAKGVVGTAIALPYRDDAGQIRFAHGVCGEGDVPSDVWLVAKDGKLVELRS